MSRGSESSNNIDGSRRLSYDGCGGGVPETVSGSSGSGGKCTPNSFVPGTEVVLADGSSKAIEEVELGDRVLATDPESGETEARRVTATITGEGAKNLVEVTVDVGGDRGGATESVTATAEHPFWVPDRGEWVEAEDLTAGDRVRTAEGEQRLVTSIRTWTALQRVHNLTVDEDHTYYVALNDHDETLVHNSDCSGEILNEFDDYVSARRDAIENSQLGEDVVPFY